MARRPWSKYQQIHRQRKPLSRAERQKLWRDRRDRGVWMAGTEMIDDTLDGLLAKGKVTQDEIENPEKLARALGDVLMDVADIG